MSRRVRLVIFAAGLVFFAILVAQAGLHGLVATIRRAGWVIPAIVGVWGCVYVSNTIAWRALIGATAARWGRAGSRPNIPGLRAYVISVASFAINYATPFVALGGEPFRLASASEWIGTDRAAASVVSFRVVHTLGQLIFWMIAVPVAWVVLPGTAVSRLALAFVGVILTACIAFMLSLFRRGLAVRALGAVRRLPLIRRIAPRLERVRATLENIDSQMAVLTDGERPRLVAAIAAEVVGRAIAMVEFYLIARGEGLHIGYPTAFVIGAFSQLAIILMIFIPFELGSREGGLYLIYRILGLPPALGVYAAVVSRIRELIWIGIGLTFVWVSSRHKHRPARVSPAGAS